MRRFTPLAFLAAVVAVPVVAQMTMPTETPGKLDPKATSTVEVSIPITGELALQGVTINAGFEAQ